MNPPKVYELTIPRSHKTTRRTRIVSNIGSSEKSRRPYDGDTLVVQAPCPIRGACLAHRPFRIAPGGTIQNTLWRSSTVLLAFLTLAGAASQINVLAEQ